MKKEIIIIADSLGIGGIEKSLVNMLNEFDYDLFNVDLMLYEKSGELIHSLNKNVNLLEERSICKTFAMPIKEVIRNGYINIAYGRIVAKVKSEILSKVKKINEIGYYQVQCTYDLTHKLLGKEKKVYDIAIGYAWPHNYTLYNVDAKIKIGWIHTDYSTIYVDRKRDFKMWSKLDFIISISKECTKAFLDVYPDLKDKVILIENITGPKLILDMSNDEFEINMRKDCFNILSIGRICNAKGFDIAVNALKCINDRGYKDIMWHIIGFGPDEEKVRQLIDENCINSNFILHGKKKNPYPFLKKCDLYVQPSRYEGKAVTVTEAKILGKPIIVSNYKTAKSQVNHMVDGYISNLTVEDLADSIIKLYKDSLLREKFSNTCKSYNYDNNDELNKLYELIY
ncbi:MAG: glycosyltransferase [Clostridium sp.]|uniref:glycosyltransferase n=1 Tax=Clostridium sp. TaxID=1506 RepID=UPI003F34B37A